MYDSNNNLTPRKTGRLTDWLQNNLNLNLNLRARSEGSQSRQIVKYGQQSRGTCENQK
jgi:hypothetical protein